MAQVMVNFRIDETIKKNMEQACREMGLSMTTAFTIFATKVGREKRIPFEVTAEPPMPLPCPRQPAPAEGGFPARKLERLERLCGELRRSLTAIHTAIPSSITGLSMERIRLLCGGELKDKTANIAASARSLFSGGNADMLREKDLSVLEEYLDGLSSVAEDVREIEHTLVPSMRAWSGGDPGVFAAYEQRLTGVSQAMDGLQQVMQRFLRSSAPGRGSARSVQARIQQAALPVQTAYVLTALENLEDLVLRHYDSLDRPVRAHLESYYLETLERTLRELCGAEQSGGDAAGNAALCLRAINVLSQIISDSRQARQELNSRSLEAEVAALERLAAMRGDIAGGVRPD